MFSQPFVVEIDCQRPVLIGRPYLPWWVTAEKFCYRFLRWVRATRFASCDTRLSGFLAVLVVKTENDCMGVQTPTSSAVSRPRTVRPTRVAGGVDAVKNWRQVPSGPDDRPVRLRSTVVVVAVKPVDHQERSACFANPLQYRSPPKLHPVPLHFPESPLGRRSTANCHRSAGDASIAGRPSQKSWSSDT